MSSIKWEDTLTPTLKQIEERLAAGEHLVKVGVPDDKAMDRDGKATSLDLGTVGLMVEFGTETAPERPAFRHGLARGMKDINRLNELNLHLVMMGKKPLLKALQELGLMGVAKVKMEIHKGDFVPNAPSTIAKKGSSKPWIDTAQFKNSITFQVVE